MIAYKGISNFLIFSLAYLSPLLYSYFSRLCVRDDILGYRLAVGQRILVPSTGVRFSLSQPCPSKQHTARSSSGSGRRPLKAEITSSNLVRATNCSRAALRPFSRFSTLLPTLGNEKIVVIPDIISTAENNVYTDKTLAYQFDLIRRFHVV